MKEQLKAKIYSTNFEKPKTLVHYVGGLESPDFDAYDQVIETGLQVRKSNNWPLDDLLINRPHGIFFFGEEMDKPLSHKITVDVSDIDTDKLYAYPSILADAAVLIKAGRADEELAKIVKEIMAETEATPYDEYDGSFAAEWIYTEDISAEIIH